MPTDRTTETLTIEGLSCSAEVSMDPEQTSRAQLAEAIEDAGFDVAGA